MRTNKTKNEIDKITKWENKMKRKKSKLETNRYIFDFQQFETIRYFGNSIYNGKILTTKKMLQRLPIALAQVKAGNTSKNLLN